MRVAVHDLQSTSSARAFFALISPRVVIAPLPDLRERFILVRAQQARWTRSFLQHLFHKQREYRQRLRSLHRVRLYGFAHEAFDNGLGDHTSGALPDLRRCAQRAWCWQLQQRLSLHRCISSPLPITPAWEARTRRAWWSLYRTIGFALVGTIFFCCARSDFLWRLSLQFGPHWRDI